MNFEQLNGLLQDKFQLDTFCSYLKSGEQRSFKLLSAFQQIIDAFDPESNNDQYIQMSEQDVNQIIIDNDLSNDNIITLSEGFTTVGTITNDINLGLTDYMNGIISDVSAIPITVTNASGDLLSQISFADVIDDLKNSMGSSVLERAAIQSASEGNIADKLAKFSTIAENSININSEIFTNTVNYYKTMLINDMSGIDIISKVFTDSGVNDLDNGEPVIIKEYPIYQYTGCSPLGALSFNTVNEALRTTGQIVGNTCNAIWNGVKKVGSWIWGKAKKYTTEVFTNPYDITDNGDESTTYCFNNFQYQTTGARVSGFFRVTNPSLTVNVMNQLQQEMNANANQWYFMQTIGGEMAVRFSNITITLNETDAWVLAATVDTIFKPYSLAEIPIPGYNTDDGISINDYSTYINSQTGKRYLSTNDSESDLLNSFINGTAVHWGVISSYVTEAFSGTSKLYPNNFIHYTSDDITNKDVFEVATGLKREGMEQYRFLKKAITAYNPLFNNYRACYDIADLGLLLVLLIANLKLENDILSNNTRYYVPYMKEDFTMSQGRFGIKTDEENQDLATAFANAIIIIASVALIVVSGKVIINKIAKSIFWKRTEFISKCNNAMWNGQTLSNSEKRKYLRFTRKLKASALLTKGLSNEIVDNVDSIPTSLFTNIIGNEDGINLSSIYRVIK